MKKALLISAPLLAVIAVTLFVFADFDFMELGHYVDDARSHETESHADDDGHNHPKMKSGTGGFAEKKEDVHADDEKGEAPVHLTDEQRKLIKIELSSAAAGEVDGTLHLNGEIQLNSDLTARMMPRMPGFVTQVAVREGDRVRKGELLAKLTSHKLGEYYSDFNSATEREALALSEFKMAETLRGNNAVSEKEFLRSKREYADAVISRRRAEALLKSLLLDPEHPEHLHEGEAKSAICTEYEIRAPFDGTVIAKDISVGENFAEDNTKVIFVISDLSRLWLDLRAGNRELSMLKTGMPVTVFPADSSAAYPGIISYVSPLIDEATRTGLVRVDIAGGSGELRPGEFAAGVIRPRTGGSTILVPREAVQLIGGERVVFVPRGDGFAPRVVTVGKSANGFSQILSGLKAGETYVSSGAFELKSVLLTGGMDAHAGHGH